MGGIDAMANMKVDKTTITNELNNLNKYGFRVMCFNSKNPMPTGAKDMTDYLITGKDKVFWIEAKLGKDTLSPGQRSYMEWIIRISQRLDHKVVYWLLITDDNYQQITDMIFNNNGYALSEYVKVNYPIYLKTL